MSRSYPIQSFQRRSNESHEDFFFRRMNSLVEYEPNTGCTLWTGRLSNAGYPEMRVDTKRKLVTRAMFLFIGQDPEGLCVLHSCDTPACVNIAHLRLGTQAENSADAAKRNRYRRYVKTWKPLTKAERQYIADNPSLSSTKIADHLGRYHGTIRNFREVLQRGGLTKSQREFLDRMAAEEGAVAARGLGPMAQSLEHQGLCRRGGFGQYLITEAGRRALSEQGNSDA